jgi:uncharacterized iron-regulated protein
MTQIHVTRSCSKNQVLKVLKKVKLNSIQAKSRGWIILGIIYAIFLWGCAMPPTKKLVVKDTAQSFEEGTIISTRANRTITFEEFLAELACCGIIYVGEEHTDHGHHKIQLEIIQAIFKQHPTMTVGMEMFARSYQNVLDLWSAGKLDQKEFLRKTHWYANWRYSFSLYQEILNFIQENHIRLVGLNIPFDIPAKIRAGGIENLSECEKGYLPSEVDTSNTAHRDYLQDVFNQHHFKGEVEFEDFYMAQSVWEDGMAEAIAQNCKDNVMVVLAGNGHIQYKYGIPQRAFKRTGVIFRTVYLASAGDEVALEVADYIWVSAP